MKFNQLAEYNKIKKFSWTIIQIYGGKTSPELF